MNPIDVNRFLQPEQLPPHCRIEGRGYSNVGEGRDPVTWSALRG